MNPKEEDPVARRLRRLKHRPLDMASLQRRVREAVSGSTPDAPSRRTFTRLTPARAIAASLLVVTAVVAALILWRAGAASIPVADLLQVHRENVAGVPTATAVVSMDAARQALAAKWGDGPRLPDVGPTPVVSCHIHRLAGKRLACLTLNVDGRPVTLAVADARDVRLEESPRVSRGGVSYCTQSCGNVNIVSVRRGGMWLCWMGELPVERLVDTAALLRV